MGTCISCAGQAKQYFYSLKELVVRLDRLERNLEAKKLTLVVTRRDLDENLKTDEAIVNN